MTGTAWRLSTAHITCNSFFGGEGRLYHELLGIDRGGRTGPKYVMFRVPFAEPESQLLIFLEMRRSKCVEYGNASVPN